MPERREFDVFSWAFLDVITSGFGAVVLMFVIINSQVTSRADDATRDLRSETTKIEEEVLEGRKNLVRLRNSVKERQDQARVVGATADRMAEILKELQANQAKAEESLARKEAVEKLQADIKQLEEANKALSARVSAPTEGTGQSLRSFVGEGNRQYLTGVRMGGSHVLILVDASASMLGRTYVNVVRFRALPDAEKRRAPKWRQTVDTVDWLTSQIRPGAAVQIYTFNEDAHSVVDGTDGQWIDVRDGKELTKAVDALRKVVPAKGTSLVNAVAAMKALNPAPDNVFLLTDGLPTQGKVAPAGTEMVSSSRRVDYFQQAARDWPRRIPANIMLYPMDGDPDAAGLFWQLAWATGGSMLTPARDWP